MWLSRQIWIVCLLLTVALPTWSTPNATELNVWANEAIVATYSFSAQNFMLQQRNIAKYFTAKSWIAYSKALQEAKLPEIVAKNNYIVSSVALMPPVIKMVAKDEWQAIMPTLVVYTNPTAQQKQTLDVTITFKTQPDNLGVRGLAITSLQSKVTKEPCACSN